MTPALRGHLAMLTFSASVAGSFSLGAIIANDIDPAALTVARFVLAAAILLAVAALGPGLRRADLVAPWRFGVIGGIYAVYFVLMFEGLKTAPAVATAAVFTLSPVLSAAFGWVLLRQGLSRRVALALAIGALGALWVIFRADLRLLLAFQVGRGEVVYFIGCIFHAALPVVMALGARRGGALASTGLAMLAGAVLLLPWGWGAIAATDWANLSPMVWGTLIYVAVFATTATVVLMQYASARLPAAKVMAYTYLVPSWVILWELALGRPVPPALVVPGIALTILALMMLLKHDQRTPQAL